MTHVLPVRLPSGSYDVLIGSGLLEEAGERLRDLAAGRRLAVVTDAVVAPIFADRLLAALEPVGAETSLIVLPAGEETKSFDGLAGLCDQLLQKGLDRGDLVLALGGGVIGDIAGFAAAIYKRGVDFVQLPTSLLAQVDSSVGGKTAIDTPRGKNVIGAFHQPRRVLADLDALNSLPPREVRCGFAEIIKYGLLGDAGFFAWLETNGAAVRALRPGPLAHAVVRSVEMKAQIVAEDEKEAGRRALLNLGHTFGHALETETGFGGALLHGEAVGAGMAMAFRFSAALRLCNPLDARRVERALRGAGLPTTLAEIFREPPSADRLIAHMAQDKKAKAGALVFVLARAIGDAFLARGVDAEALRRFLLEDGAV